MYLNFLSFPFSGMRVRRNLWNLQLEIKFGIFTNLTFHKRFHNVFMALLEAASAGKKDSSSLASNHPERSCPRANEDEDGDVLEMSACFLPSYIQQLQLKSCQT